jgi:hypothetical protein
MLNVMAMTAIAYCIYRLSAEGARWPGISANYKANILERARLFRDPRDAILSRFIQHFASVDLRGAPHPSKPLVPTSIRLDLAFRLHCNGFYANWSGSTPD